MIPKGLGFKIYTLFYPQHSDIKACLSLCSFFYYVIMELAFNNNQHSQKGDKRRFEECNLRVGRMVAWLMMVQICQGSPTQPDWTNSPLVQWLVMAQLWMKPNHVTDGCHKHTLAVDISLTKRRIQLKLNPLDLEQNGLWVWMNWWLPDKQDPHNLLGTVVSRDYYGTWRCKDLL
jgi:hypothetical protein